MEEKKQSQEKELEELDRPDDNLFEDLPEEDQLILDYVPQEKKEKVAKVLLQKRTIIQMSHSGPLPHPSQLKGYEGVIKGGAERLLIMVEKQAEHRMSIEKTVVNSQMKQSERGQHYGLIITFLCVLSGTAMAFYGLQMVATALLTTTLASLVAIFVIGKKGKNTDKKQEE